MEKKENKSVPFSLDKLEKLKRSTALVDDMLSTHGISGPRAILLREALRNVAALDGVTPALLELLLRGVEEWERNK